MSRAWVVPVVLWALLLAAGGALAAEYWAAPVFGDAADHELLLANPGPAAADVTVWRADGSSTSINTPIHSRTVHVVPSGLRAAGVAPEGLRIEATGGVLPTLVGPAAASTTSAGTTLLPTPLLGRDHFVATPDFEGAPEPWIAVVATAPGTEVELTFRVPLTAVADGGAGTPTGAGRLTYTLDAHETLTVTATQDLTGTRVSADAPVAVFAGRRDPGAASVESMAGDQVPPVGLAGTEHVICTQEHAGPNWVWAAHIIAVEDGVTEVRLGGGAGSPIITLTGAGATALVPWTTADMWLRADQPVLVAQSMRGNNGFPPDMSYVPPVASWGREATLGVPGGTSTGAFQVHLTMAHRTGHAPEVDPAISVQRREVAMSPFSCSVTGHLQVDNGDPGVAQASFGVGGGAFQSWGGHSDWAPFSTVQTTAWTPCRDAATAPLHVDVEAQDGAASVSWHDGAIACSGHVRYQVAREAEDGSWVEVGVVTGRLLNDDGSVVPLPACEPQVWRVTRLEHGRSADSRSIAVPGPGCPAGPTRPDDGCPVFSETNPEVFTVTVGDVLAHRFRMAGNGHNIVAWSATGLPAYAHITPLTGDFVWDTREAAIGHHGGLAVLLEAPGGCTARHDFAIEVVAVPPRCPVLQGHRGTLDVPLGGQSSHTWHVLDPDDVGFELQVLPPTAFVVEGAAGEATAAVRTSGPELNVRIQANSVQPGTHGGGLVRLVAHHAACPPEAHDLSFVVVAPAEEPPETTGTGEEGEATRSGEGGTGGDGTEAADGTASQEPAAGPVASAVPERRPGGVPGVEAASLWWTWTLGCLLVGGLLLGLLWRRRSRRSRRS